MKRTMKLGLVSFLTGLALLLPLIPSRARAQNGDVSSEHAAALSTLAEYMFGRVDLAHTLLMNHGYTPAMDQVTWRQFPSVRKLETAYIAAEKADPGRGGERLLALLSADLARHYESVRSEPTLQPYLRKSVPVLPLHFANPDHSLPRPNLAKSVEAAIDTISLYCGHGPAGAPQFILRTYFNIQEDTAYRLLRESNSNAEALKRAMTYVPEQERDPLLRKLTSTIAKKYEAARYEPALLPFMGGDSGKSSSSASDMPPSEPRPPIPPTGSGSPRTNEEPRPLISPGGTSLAFGTNEDPRPKVPTRGAGVPTAAERYPTFVTENYSTAESMGFSVMSEVVEGFGGIVFGNDVSADPHLPKIGSISFQKSDTGQTGSLVYHFADHDPLTFDNVRVEDAYAAYHIVYQTLSGVPPFQPGKGIGLMSLEENTPSIVCDGNVRTVKQSTRFNVVLHPALANLDLGWAAIMVDSLPIEPELITRSFIKRGLGDESALAIKNLFLSMETRSFVHNWKVVDVPLKVAMDHGSLVVSNSVDDSSIPVGIRRTAFIEMRPMFNKGFNPQFARDFYQDVPILTQGSRDYERLNTFAAVLAIVRLAKIEGVPFTTAPPVPGKIPTPDAIQLTENGIAPIASFNAVSALKGEESKVQACMETVLRSSAELGKAVEALQSLEKAFDVEALKIYYLRDDLNKEQKESLIRTTAKEYQPKIDATEHQILAFPAGPYVMKLFSYRDTIDELAQRETLAASRVSAQRH
jgi:hypothetical protein